MYPYIGPFRSFNNKKYASTLWKRRAGITAIPYHAKIPLAERTDNLDRFRTYVAKTNNSTSTSSGSSAPVLVSTDLASRGLDIPGVTAIVQLQFAGNVISHLHRMGRCGRAGERNGRGIIFYSPREKTLVDVVREAEKQQQEQQMVLHGDVHDEDEAPSTSSAADGTVIKAFSRRRGFTKKIKKNRRKEQQQNSSS
jgi:superfamily II DNA/RNA helicase